MKTVLVLAAIICFTRASAETTVKPVVIHVAQLSQMLEHPEGLSVYDVNVNSTREHVGIIPGARLIDSASQYDLAKMLPADKNAHLVFYCANELCTSSDQAATRATQAGYTNVSVMKDGIYGWKKAGKKLDKIDLQVSATNGNSGYSNVEPGEAMELVRQNHAVIVDVREQEERHEIIPGAKWFPMSKATDAKAWSEFKKGIPQGETAIFHCASGIRSKKIAERLAKEGISTLYFSSADQWKAAGLPVEKGPAID